MKEELKIALSGNLNEYKSVPFWSWNNSLDEKELVKQIEDMKSAGIGGFIMHARTGLKDEYLGEKWFSCIAACLKKARELNMQAWVYDENGWPSGFVGGKLLKNESFRARYLEYAVGDFDPSAFASYIADEKNGFIRVQKPKDGVKEYHNIYLRISPANTDILNPHVTDAFIAETHEKYYERFKESFGKELAGFFTDEPQYYRWATPYTPYVCEAFSKDGTDVKDGLIWLFVHGEKGYRFRLKYYGELNRLYVTNFYKKIYDWCNAHGCMLTGHSIEESNLAMQMWGGAGVSTSYEYEHIPAIDHLGRKCMGDFAPRQVASVACQLGKKRILTETYACAGNDVTPYELKSIGDAQYFLGVNSTCQHLYPYSMARGGKTDHPPVFSPQGNWFEGFKVFNEYFTRLGYIVANTKECTDIGIIHPLRDVWLDYIGSEIGAGVESVERRFADLLADLRKHGVSYHLIDETILQKHGKTDGDKLIVGNEEYETVLVPEMKSISESTYRLLKEYRGRLYVAAKPQYLDGVKREVELNSNISYGDMLGKAAVKFICEDARSFAVKRAGEIGEFIFVKNLSYDQPSEVLFAGLAAQYKELDLGGLKEKNICDSFVLRAGEGKIFVKDERAKRVRFSCAEQDVTQNFRVTEIGENYLVLDYVRLSKDGKTYGNVRPVYGAFEELLRENYKGKLYIRQEFTLREIVPASLIMEKAKMLSLTVNGAPISLSRGGFDINFEEADVTEHLRIGKNVIEYAIDFYEHDGVHFALFDPLATESLRNCLYFDTSIEPAYLRGKFIVNKDLSLSKAARLPDVTDNLPQEGYPFFKGSVTYEGTIEKAETGRTEIDLRGRFLTAEIIAGDRRENIVLDTCADVTDLLMAGKNKVRITIRSSLRNLFGPHHYIEAEPLAVSPYHFEFRGEWRGGKNPENYTDEYHSMPFGIRQILVKNIEEAEIGESSDNK